MSRELIPLPLHVVYNQAKPGGRGVCKPIDECVRKAGLDGVDRGDIFFGCLAASSTSYLALESREEILRHGQLVDLTDEALQRIWQRNVALYETWAGLGRACAEGRSHSLGPPRSTQWSAAVLCVDLWNDEDTELLLSVIHTGVKMFDLALRSHGENRKAPRLYAVTFPRHQLNGDRLQMDDVPMLGDGS